jgi:hypothetical protein
MSCGGGTFHDELDVLGHMKGALRILPLCLTALNCVYDSADLCCGDEKGAQYEGATCGNSTSKSTSSIPTSACLVLGALALLGVMMGGERGIRPTKAS